MRRIDEAKTKIEQLVRSAYQDWHTGHRVVLCHPTGDGDQSPYTRQWHHESDPDPVYATLGEWARGEYTTQTVATYVSGYGLRPLTFLEVLSDGEPADGKEESADTLEILDSDTGQVDQGQPTGTP